MKLKHIFIIILLSINGICVYNLYFSCNDVILAISLFIMVITGLIIFIYLFGLLIWYIEDNWDNNIFKK